jgi:hypothetical protein
MRFMLLLSVVALVVSAGTAVAQPGIPVAGCVPPPGITFAEPTPEQPGLPEHITMTLQCPVTEGAVVLFEDPTKDPRDPHNWSDVLVFSGTAPIPPQPGQFGQIATYVSDTEDAAGNSLGITDADLAAAGLPFPVASLLALPDLILIPESTTSVQNIYQPGPSIVYILISDSPERPVPANATTWGRVKASYR